MKKIIIITFFAVLVFISCVDTKTEIIEGSNQVIQGICKKDVSYIQSLIGVIFEKKGIDASNLLDKDIQIVDYEMKAINKSNEIWEVFYNIKTENEAIHVKIEWKKQPKEWLVSDIKIINPDEITSYMSDDLITQIDAVCVKLVKGDYKELYGLIADDFGEQAGYKIGSAEALLDYLEYEFSFFQPQFNTYEILNLSKISASGDDEVIVEFNKGQPGSFRLGLNFDDKLRLSGLYCIEFEHAKEGIITQLSLNNVEDYYQEDEISESYSLENKEHLESAEIYSAHVYEYLASNNYKMLYVMMDDFVRSKLSFNQFTRYMTLMRKRSFTKNLDTYLGAILDINISYDEPTFMLSANGYVKDSFEHQFMTKEDAQLKHGFTAYIEVNEDVISSDDPDSISNDLIGLVLNSASLYEINSEYYQTLSDEEQMNYYVPQLDGTSLEYSDQDNHNMRLEKSFELIKALKYKDFDALWSIESYHTGLENIDELKEYYDLQVKLIGSFNSIYLPIQGYPYLMTGQFIVEFAFVDQNDQLSKLMITFDSDNRILSYDVMNVKRRNYEENN